MTELRQREPREVDEEHLDKVRASTDHLIDVLARLRDTAEQLRILLGLKDIPSDAFDKANAVLKTYGR